MYFVIDPKNRFKIAFDIFMAIVYLVCYLIDPFVCAFYHDVFVQSPQLNHIQRFLTFIIVIDLITEPLTAKVKLHQNIEEIDES